MTDLSLRDEIKAALSVAGSYCGECTFEPGDSGCPDCERVRGQYADAVIAKLRKSRRLIDPVVLARYRDLAADRRSAELLVVHARQWNEDTISVEELAKALRVDDDEDD
jgi:hypothetical protein